ncbi:hypothetical protein HO133_007972 [Letharia lupina]|uniref:Uncharacterized protein n=1 Tax=Letharia lupina TaxID=560253 RepID=A0A8H6CRJ1_9LECA|nr:uncharacterized protein HO133_007972 [Letharia lupina]KAF6228242.1 hypothetical protein HO133_007972 [Letharia lupina]
MDAFYLRGNTSSENGIDLRDLQIPLFRPFRALKVWFVIRTYGVEGFTGLISETTSGLDLFTVAVPPAFALTAINIIPCASNGGRDTNGLTKAVYTLICQQGEIMVTSTVVAGLYIIRVVSSNPDSQGKYIERAFTILVTAAEDVLSRG